MALAPPFLWRCWSPSSTYDNQWRARMQEAAWQAAKQGHAIAHILSSLSESRALTPFGHRLCQRRSLQAITERIQGAGTSPDVSRGEPAGAANPPFLDNLEFLFYTRIRWQRTCVIEMGANGGIWVLAQKS